MFIFSNLSTVQAVLHPVLRPKVEDEKLFFQTPCSDFNYDPPEFPDQNTTDVIQHEGDDFDELPADLPRWPARCKCYIDRLLEYDFDVLF